MDWFSIEILDGSTSAATWAEIFRDSLVADAVSMAATDWSWHRHAWGVVFEVAFDGTGNGATRRAPSIVKQAAKTR